MEQGLKKIIEKILSEAKHEEARIVSEARKEADALLQQAEQEAEAEAARLDRQHKETAATIKERVKASARLSAKLRYLRAENKAIEAAFARAEKELRSFKAGRKYPDWLEKEIVAALANETATSAELAVAGSDRRLFNQAFFERLRKRLECELRLAAESRSILGGVIITIPEKSIEINRSFEAKLAACREKQITALAKILYPGRDKAEGAMAGGKGESEGKGKNKARGKEGRRKK